MLNSSNLTPRVLLIDDDELSTRALAKRLQKRGLKTTVLTHPAETMEYLEKEKVDLILLDIVMPELDGLGLLKLIRKKYDKNELPVLMLTGVADSFEISEAFRLMANDYITKPINIEALIARIFGQLNGVYLMKLGNKKRDRDLLNSVVVTYHHEINNPLAILLAKLQILDSKNPTVSPKDVGTMISAVMRIMDILKKIKTLTKDGEIELGTYLGDTTMVGTQKRKRS